MATAQRAFEAIDDEAPASRFLKIGAVCACASGVLALAGHVLHGPADVSVGGMHHLAAHGSVGIYRADHFLLALALLFALCGCAAIADSMRRLAAIRARFSMLLAQMGSAVIMVALGIDGFALIAVARAWARAAAAERKMIFQAGRPSGGHLSASSRRACSCSSAVRPC